MGTLLSSVALGCSSGGLESDFCKAALQQHNVIGPCINNIQLTEFCYSELPILNQGNKDSIIKHNKERNNPSLKVSILIKS